MTFHVLYNDCHLEADMEGERRGERGEGRGGCRATVGWARRDGGRGRRREQKRQQPALESCDRTALNWPPFLPVLLPGETQSESVSVFSPVCSPSSATLHSFAIDIVKPNSFKVDYTMNCAARAAIFYLQGWAGPAQRPVPRAVTWTRSWLSFTPSSLMRPDSRNWS